MDKKNKLIKSIQNFIKQLKNNYYNITISINKMVSLFVFSRNKQKGAQFKELFNNIKHSDYNFTISRNYKYADFFVSFTRNDINYFINKHRTININYVLYSFLTRKRRYLKTKAC